MAKFHIQWKTNFSPTTCRICTYLHGRVWMLEAEQKPRVISHPHYGDVWDLYTETPLTHGHGPWNCHCELLITVSDPELEEMVRTALTETLNATGLWSTSVRSLKV
jgi:hypothetical protein